MDIVRAKSGNDFQDDIADRLTHFAYFRLSVVCFFLSVCLSVCHIRTFTQNNNVALDDASFRCGFWKIDLKFTKQRRKGCMPPTLN